MVLVGIYFINNSRVDYSALMIALTSCENPFQHVQTKIANLILDDDPLVEPKKTAGYFPWITGCLIKMLIILNGWL